MSFSKITISHTKYYLISGKNDRNSGISGMSGMSGMLGDIYNAIKAQLQMVEIMKRLKLRN